MGRSKTLLRAAEWCLLLMVAVAPPIFTSFHAGAVPVPASLNNTYELFLAFQEAVMLALLMHLLHRQGRRWADIGFSFETNDIRAAFILTAFCYGSTLLAYYGTTSIYFLIVREPLILVPQHMDFLRGPHGPGMVLLVLINPFFEELIVRAYTMTEMRDLTGSSLIAVVVSVLVQMSYHSYQGAYALVTVLPMTILFSLYFAKWKRAGPVVLAHLVFDILLLWYWPT